MPPTACWAGLPRAEQWLRFCLPRLERTLRALPIDGVIPTTSYHWIGLYIDKMVLFREPYRQATGDNVYERPALRRLVDYCVESYTEERGEFLHASPRGDLVQFASGHAFFDQMARTFGDADAAWLADQCRQLIAHRTKGDKNFATSLGTLYAALLHDGRQPGTLYARGGRQHLCAGSLTLARSCTATASTRFCSRPAAAPRTASSATKMPPIPAIG